MDRQIWMMLELIPRLNLVLLKSITVMLFSLPLGLGGCDSSPRPSMTTSTLASYRGRPGFVYGLTLRVG